MHPGLISEVETAPSIQGEGQGRAQPALMSVQKRQDRAFPSWNWVCKDFPCGSGVKNPPANTGGVKDSDSIPGSGRSPGGRNGNPLQYS